MSVWFIVSSQHYSKWGPTETKLIWTNEGLFYWRTLFNAYHVKSQVKRALVFFTGPYFHSMDSWWVWFLWLPEPGCYSVGENQWDSEHRGSERTGTTMYSCVLGHTATRKGCQDRSHKSVYFNTFRTETHFVDDILLHFFSDIFHNCLKFYWRLLL